LALAGLLPGKSVSRGRAFRSDSCPSEKESTSLSTPAARPVVPDSPPHRGPGTAAGHRGPHYSEEPGQRPEPKQQQASAYSCSCSCSCFRFCFRASSPSAGQEGPLLFRGPCAAVRAGRQARRGIGRDADPFSYGQSLSRT